MIGRQSAGVAVVTGAGRGIGRATALALGRRGMSVALLARTREELAVTARAFAEIPAAKALVAPCDVKDAGSVHEAALAVINALGAPTVVINNAGVVRRAFLTETTEADWDDVIGANLKGTFLVTRAFLPAMLARGSGRIVNVASISATLGTPGQTAYNAAKWGVVGFTKSLAEELRGTGLQALAVLPGAVDTAMLVGSGFAPQMTPEIVAETLVYAALDAPSAMNGSAIEVFGP
jgi:NAD(P)-dependent dehydrogenase (short-subunit alcohol dehydrogenase family)